MNWKENWNPIKRGWDELEKLKWNDDECKAMCWTKKKELKWWWKRKNMKVNLMEKQVGDGGDGGDGRFAFVS